jgi:hypothetical protein
MPMNLHLHLRPSQLLHSQPLFLHLLRTPRS